MQHGLNGFLGKTPHQSNFLTQKFHTSGLITAAKTGEEYFRIMQQLVQSITTSSAKSNMSKKSKPLIDLGNDNEDDYFGILPPIKPTGL